MNKVKIKNIMKQIAALLAALGSRLIGMSRKLAEDAGPTSLAPDQNYINKGINIIQTLPTDSVASAAVAQSPQSGPLKGLKKGDSFVLYTCQYDTLQLLEDKDLGRVIKGVFRAVSGELQANVEKTLGNLQSMITFRDLMRQITFDRAKYDRKCATNAMNATARWNKSRKNKKAVAQVDNAGEPEQAKGVEEGAVAPSSPETGTEVVAEVKTEVTSASNDDEPEFSREDMKFANCWMAWFNKTLETNGSSIPRIRKMTPKRVKMLLYLGRKHGKDVLEEVVRRAAQKDFLNGRGKKSYFVADIDWLFKEQNFMNVYENKFY